LLCCPSSDHSSAAQIEVDAKDITGSISPYFFGQFIEHEHNTIQGGLWAELLRDREFEEGDADGDGVSNGWVPQERTLDQYWQLSNGRGSNVRYFLDHNQYYGGGESQGIALHGPGSQKKSIYQIGLRLARGRRYHFYVYLMGKGSGAGFVELDSLGGTVYGHKDFGIVPAMWHKYEADFTATEDTDKARLSIGFSGAGTFWIDSASLMPADNANLPGLDSAATISSDGRTLYLAVINRDEVNAINTSINFKNWQITPGSIVHAFELNGVNRDAANPYGSTANTHIQEKHLEADGTSLSYAFSPHSVTVLELGTSMK
jgi:hypothetical protein